MAKVFVYKAKNMSGQMLSGTLLADNADAVAAYIRGKGFYVLRLGEESLLKGALMRRLQPISDKALAVFCRQFHTLLSAGVPMLSCLTLLIEHNSNPRLRTALQEVLMRIKEGESLSYAVSRHPQVFPDLMVQMLYAAETAGVFDSVLDWLAVHFEKKYKLSQRLITALAYPGFITAVAGIAFVILLIFVMPVFTQLFASMRLELPATTRLLLAAGGFLGRYGVYLGLVLAMTVYGFIVFYRTEAGRFWCETVIGHCPVVGTLVRNIALVRFSRNLGLLVRGGTDILIALDVVKKTLGHAQMAQALSQAQTVIATGGSLTTAFSEGSLFGALVAPMLSIGEETGRVDVMLDRIGDFYENEVEDMTTRLHNLLEPCIIGVLGVAVGFIAIAVLMPLFDAMINIGQR